MSMYQCDTFSDKYVTQQAESTKECWQDNLAVYWLPRCIIDLLKQGKFEPICSNSSGTGTMCRQETGYFESICEKAHSTSLPIAVCQYYHL